MMAEALPLVASIRSFELASARAFLADFCPNCPTQRAARELFFADDLGLRLGGMLGPFIVTAGLIALLVGKLRRHQRGRP